MGNLEVSHRPLLINLSFLLDRPTGLATYANNLLPHLESLKPVLLSAQQLGESYCYPTPANISSEHGRIGHLRRLLWTQLALPKIYQQLDSKLLFSPIPEAPLYTSCRSVVTAHDVIPLRFSRKLSPLTQYFRHYIPQVLKQAEHIVCNSVTTARDLVDFYGIAASKITPILLAYDSSHFQALNLPSQNYFLYLGRYDPYKNLHRLVEAFSRLSSACDCSLWIAGPKESRYTPQLMAHIDSLGLSQRIKFLDYVPYEDLPKLINQAIAFVFPSLWEGFGLPVLEAMACGTPVITSNISSLPEVAGEAAILVDPYNVDEIADALKAIVNDSGLRFHLRKAGLARAGMFSWEKTGQTTIEVLRRYL